MSEIETIKQTLLTKIPVALDCHPDKSNEYAQTYKTLCEAEQIESQTKLNAEYHSWTIEREKVLTPLQQQEG